jgi:hypothetical protein
MPFYSNISIENTRFSFLPYDLVEFINSLNYDWAAKIIQKKIKNNICKKVNELTKLCYFAYEQCNLPTNMSNCSIFYKNKILNRQEIIKTFSACNCCTKHQINKPKELTNWNDTPMNFTQDLTCGCACRHISRFLCRELVN